MNSVERIYEEEDFVKYLESILGSDVNMKIEHVNGISTHTTGKFIRSICNFSLK